MEFTGKISEINNDIINGSTKVTFTVNEPKKALEEYKSIKDCEKLIVKAVKFRNKRSLNANAYFHLLVGKLAKKLNMSATRCKNEMIHDYGQVLYAGDDEAVIKTNIPPEIMLEMEEPHCYPCHSEIQTSIDKRTSKPIEKEIVFYRVYRNTRDYNTAEMAALINGVIEECKAQGIDTATPDELARIMSSWDREVKKRI